MKKNNLLKEAWSKVNNKQIQLCIVFVLGILMLIALIIDGEFGERVFGMLIASFGVILGYFFRKAHDDKCTKQ